ncbi:hypothetical protein SEA_MADAMATO_70 [Streptomyces phage Madamato]|nr:hypothetical protein SEA_MADAMATO_70 [Streptomyces phage Madamato]
MIGFILGSVFGSVVTLVGICTGIAISKIRNEDK